MGTEVPSLIKSWRDDAGLIEHLYSLLECPTCGASPDPSFPNCPQCGRSITTPGGNLDLLDDSVRAAADRFAAQYSELRTKEGWVGSDGFEDPSSGNESIWRHRVQSISKVGQTFARLNVGDARPLIVDVGSGSGWAARYVSRADVIAMDLLDGESRWALAVRADMQRLPIRTAVADGILFAASLHYGALEPVLAEAGRVLRPDGLLVVVDSPIYADDIRQAQAAARSADYYSKAGYPELADRYHPIESSGLRRALLQSGFEIERFEVDNKWQRLLGRRRRPPATFVSARRSK
jgi:SAM-dependent methyltransferase